MSMFAPDPLVRLLLVIDRQHAEDGRDGQGHIQLQYTVGHGSAYILEMGVSPRRTQPSAIKALGRSSLYLCASQ